MRTAVGFTVEPDPDNAGVGNCRYTLKPSRQLLGMAFFLGFLIEIGGVRLDILYPAAILSSSYSPEKMG